MKRIILISIVAVVALTGCNGRKFVEIKPGTLKTDDGEIQMICNVNVDTGPDHKDYVYGIVCVEGNLP